MGKAVALLPLTSGPGGLEPSGRLAVVRPTRQDQLKGEPWRWPGHNEWCRARWKCRTWRRWRRGCAQGHRYDHGSGFRASDVMPVRAPTWWRRCFFPRCGGPGRPDAVDTDTFVLSKGHAAPILWAVLSEAGAAMEPLSSLRRFGSILEGHPTPRSPWVKVSTGSLGQGLSVANGIALAKPDGRDRR